MNPLRRLTLALLLGSLVTMPLVAQSNPRIVHVFVALADNANQGIVPVPAKLGNGEDPERNLYWGSAFGVKTFFSRSPDWKLLSSGERPKYEVLERCVFKHRTANVYLVADAYRGREIQTAILNFLDAAAGVSREQIAVKDGSQTVTLDIRGWLQPGSLHRTQWPDGFPLVSGSDTEKSRSSPSDHPCLRQQSLFRGGAEGFWCLSAVVDDEPDGAGSLHAEECLGWLDSGREQ
jgi:hypothetical protein